MTPNAIRDFLAALPWETYTVGELNEIGLIGGDLLATTRNRRREIRMAEQLAQTARLPQQTAEQIAAGTTKEQIYPPGSRLE